jgi:hypothetical protein
LTLSKLVLQPKTPLKYSSSSKNGLRPVFC